MDNPLVFDIGAGGTPLKDAIVAAIEAAATRPIDISLTTAGTIPPHLTVGVTPSVVNDVPPDGEACFSVKFTGSNSPMGSFDLEFEDADSGGVLPVTVACIPNLPPSCSVATPSRNTLWPPNHRLEPISIQGVTDPDRDPVSIRITRITQDEPVNANGDGNTCPDGAGIGTATAHVRSERSGGKKAGGNGRVYHIGFAARDPHGDQCMGVVRVCVPHDHGHGQTCIDGGALVDSTRCK